MGLQRRAVPGPDALTGIVGWRRRGALFPVGSAMLVIGWLLLSCPTAPLPVTPLCTRTLIPPLSFSTEFFNCFCYFTSCITTNTTGNFSSTAAMRATLFSPSARGHLTSTHAPIATAHFRCCCRQSDWSAANRVSSGRSKRIVCYHMASPLKYEEMQEATRLGRGGLLTSVRPCTPLPFLEWRPAANARVCPSRLHRALHLGAALLLLCPPRYTQ